MRSSEGLLRVRFCCAHIALCCLLPCRVRRCQAKFPTGHRSPKQRMEPLSAFPTADLDGPRVPVRRTSFGTSRAPSLDDAPHMQFSAGVPYGYGRHRSSISSQGTFCRFYSGETAEDMGAHTVAESLRLAELDDLEEVDDEGATPSDQLYYAQPDEVLLMPAPGPGPYVLMQPMQPFHPDAAAPVTSLLARISLRADSEQTAYPDPQHFSHPDGFSAASTVCPSRQSPEQSPRWTEEAETENMRAGWFSSLNLAPTPVDTAAPVAEPRRSSEPAANPPSDRPRAPFSPPISAPAFVPSYQRQLPPPVLTGPSQPVAEDFVPSQYSTSGPTAPFTPASAIARGPPSSVHDSADFQASRAQPVRHHFPSAQQASFFLQASQMAGAYRQFPGQQFGHFPPGLSHPHHQQPHAHHPGVFGPAMHVHSVPGGPIPWSGGAQVLGPRGMTGPPHLQSHRLGPHGAPSALPPGHRSADDTGADAVQRAEEPLIDQINSLPKKFRQQFLDLRKQRRAAMRHGDRAKKYAVEQIMWEGLRKVQYELGMVASPVYVPHPPQ
eukprot:m.876041 g.876041  ORF g.876041 m.876041 type:complete len:551 (+) comp59814_c0_seq2:1517-3169(+)